MTLCAKCHYFDVVPGTKLCQSCARQPVKKPTNHQQQIAALQDTIDMLVRENTRLKETIQEQSEIIGELNEMIGTV